MDASTLITVSQVIIQVLDSSFIQEIECLWSFKSQVTKMKNTMTTIKAVLVDAEEREKLQEQRSNVICDWLEKLRDAVYEADDLLDEIATIAQRKQLISGSKLNKEASLFFSRWNQLVFAFNTSREVKKIRERLDGIAKDHRDFGSRPLVCDGWKIVTKRREDSHSFVNAQDVIGRDEDKKALIDMLLDSSVEEDLHFVTIVGIGGLGKTTLAQLVYNDERIEREFSLRLWVCVTEEFDIKTLLCKLLESSANESLEMEQLQRRVREKFSTNKYLLVLDDVWNEDRDKWLKLRDLLTGCEKGSKVVVTTRSKMVAKIIRDGSMYELGGISPEDSWHLFANMAFENDEEQTDVDLIEIGDHIIKKCANVPLALRVVGSLLYGQSKSTWISFLHTDFANIKQNKDGVISILKLSYNQLASPLKSCFNYCAVFPKDHRMQKETLVRLWMAHGFIHSSEGQSVEDVAEEYFMTLLQRCFFQDVEHDDHGEIVSCKIHDLMHDVAQVAAGKDILVANSLTSQFTDKTRHISIHGVEAGTVLSCLPKMNRLHSFIMLQSPLNQSIRGFVLSKARYLRVMDLHSLGIKSLPSTIGKLLHLRYLDLSNNYEMKSLPATLTKLNNLQTLKLSGCLDLEELPRDFCKLINLRLLDISGCRCLRRMPSGMNNLTSLHKLTTFVVSEASYVSNSKRGHAGELKDLEDLVNIRDSLEIKILHPSELNLALSKEVKYIYNMENLKEIHIGIRNFGNDDDGVIALLENLQPHPNLRGFHLEGYQGTRFPNWASEKDLGSSLPNLVGMCLSNCRKLKHLPLLSQLRYLRNLELCGLKNLEYVENTTTRDDGDTTSACQRSSAKGEELMCFPSLETLILRDLPQLQGWQRPVYSVEEKAVDLLCDQPQQILLCPQHSFPRLSVLDVTGCPKLNCIPVISSLQKLNLTPTYSDFYTDSHSLVDSCSQEGPHEQTIRISCRYVGSLSIVKELFFSHLSSSLCSLTISRWPKLKSLNGGGLEHLTALQELQLWYLDDLEEGGDNTLYNNYNDAPWKSFHQSLRHLELHHLSKLANLFQGIRYLSALESLVISRCKILEALPEWISCLTSLQSLVIRQCNGLKSLPEAIRNLNSLKLLEIEGCSGLTERCQEPNGEDWPKIQHIPQVSIRLVGSALLIDSESLRLLLGFPNSQVYVQVLLQLKDGRAVMSYVALFGVIVLAYHTNLMDKFSYVSHCDKLSWFMAIEEEYSHILVLYDFAVWWCGILRNSDAAFYMIKWLRKSVDD